MGCLHHRCIQCEHVWVDNRPTRMCPLCDGVATQTMDEVIPDTDSRVARTQSRERPNHDDHGRSHP